jgi:hypothetical protein
MLYSGLSVLTALTWKYAERDMLALLTILTFGLLADENRAQPLPPIEPAAVAAEVDRYFVKTWQENAIEPAPLCSDEEFVRRLYLDLAGRIPAVSETRQFLDDSRPDKRQLLVEQLLDSPAFVRHFTILWRNALIPEAFTDPQLRGLIPGFEAWLWTRFSSGVPYDQLVRELITTPLDFGDSPEAVLNAASSPSAFFLARNLKPESLATGTSRAFLGVRLDCAQCHDHPFDTWKQRQFWSLAAFYGGFSSLEGGGDPGAMAMVRERENVRSISIPGTGETVEARFLAGQPPQWDSTEQPREKLAAWITSKDNPWFSRMAANRMWSLFFGQGIVHPIDDFSDNNPPSHPEVLQLLADQLVAHDFDLRFLIRTMTMTRVYQATSRQTHPSQADTTQFARSALRGLTPEQFFDSLAEATGYYQPYRSDNPFVIDAESPRGRFLELFRDEAESPLLRETTILQSLAMMNGEFIADATAGETSQTLRAITEFPLMSDQQKLETLFLAALSRFPSDAELQQCQTLLATASTPEDRTNVCGDIFWALLNSSEFLLNH